MNIHDPQAAGGSGPTHSGRSIHPGSGRRKTRDTPKGRQVDPAALEEVRALLGERSREPDLLIEHLHLLQDRYRCLHARHLVALAHEMRLALVEVYEVASFYAHFDIVMDEEPAMRFTSTPRSRASRRPSRMARPTLTCRTASISTATAPRAATHFSPNASTASARSRTSSRRWRPRTSAASAERASRPGANGASCAPSPALA